MLFCPPFVLFSVHLHNYVYTYANLCFQYNHAHLYVLAMCVTLSYVHTSLHSAVPPSTAVL